MLPSSGIHENFISLILSSATKTIEFSPLFGWQGNYWGHRSAKIGNIGEAILLIPVADIGWNWLQANLDPLLGSRLSSMSYQEWATILEPWIGLCPPTTKCQKMTWQARAMNGWRMPPNADDLPDVVMKGPLLGQDIWQCEWIFYVSSGGRHSLIPPHLVSVFVNVLQFCLLSCGPLLGFSNRGLSSEVMRNFLITPKFRVRYQWNIHYRQTRAIWWGKILIDFMKAKLLYFLWKGTRGLINMT